MVLFDTHFHYDGALAPAVYRAKVAADLAGCRVTPATDRLLLLAAGGNFVDSGLARDFAAADRDNFFAAGVHPHEAAAHLAAPADFRGFCRAERCVAVGEIGLDYYYEFSCAAEQRRVLAEFLGLALEYRLPAILHCRDREGSEAAYRDLHAALADFAGVGGRMVVHCFTGSPDWAEKFLALGACLGVTGIVTFPKAENVRAAVRLIPADRLLLETDSPYLAPVPFRGKPCSPGFLPLVAARVAAERGVDPVELAAQTTANGRRLFQLEDGES